MLNDSNNFDSVFCISHWLSCHPTQNGDPVVQVILHSILKVHDRWRSDLESLRVLLVVPDLKDANLEIRHRKDGDRDVSVVVISIFESALGDQAIGKRYLTWVEAINTVGLRIGYEGVNWNESANLTRALWVPISRSFSSEVGLNKVRRRRPSNHGYPPTYFHCYGRAWSCPSAVIVVCNAEDFNIIKAIQGKWDLFEVSWMKRLLLQSG